MKLSLVVVLLLLLPVAPVRGGELCASMANVSWHTAHRSPTVDGVTVHVAGCADGQPIAIQLLTEHGDIPPHGPLMRAVADEQATYDLTEFDVLVEPVTGLRVFLEVRGDEQYSWQITLDRRFFNPAGSEQIGLRDLTILQVPHGDSYRVEGAPARYRETDCAELGYDPDDRIAEGSGLFDNVTEGGRHIVCFQQVAASRGHSGATEVLDGPLDRDPDDRTEVLGTSREQPAPSSTEGPLGRLAVTGSDLLLATAVGVATVGVGLVLLRRRHA
jgi:hypothetical protein